jgi:hypothetical protein
MLGSASVTATSGIPVRKNGGFVKDAPRGNLLDASQFYAICSVAGQKIQVVIY